MEATEEATEGAREKQGVAKQVAVGREEKSLSSLALYLA